MSMARKKPSKKTTQPDSPRTKANWNVQETDFKPKSWADWSAEQLSENKIK